MAQPPPIAQGRAGVSRVLFVHHASVQAGITLYRNAGPGDNARMAPARLLREYFGGSAGVFFQEIREARAMAYSTSGGLASGWRPGDDDLLWAQAVTQADKTVDATRLLVELLEAAPSDPGRFDRVHAAAVEKFDQERIGFRDVPGMARWWSRRGLSGDPRPALREQLRGLGLGDLADFATTIARGPVTAVVVGDAARIDLDALGTVGRLVQLTPADLMSY